MAYKPLEIRAPRLAGATIRTFVPLAESAFPGQFIRKSMVANTQIHRLREADAGSFSPHRPPFPLPPPGSHTGPPLAAAVALPARGAGWPFPEIADYRNAYRERRITPLEVAQVLLRAVRASDSATPPLRVFIRQDFNDLLLQAEESAERWHRGNPISPLDGVPIAIKDELDQVPYPTTVGTRFKGGEGATRDAAVVERLRKAGALLVGKTNMHELGIGVTGLNPHHGPVRNPYDPKCITGGSSSGSAAAVAVGFCPAAVGADGGGSIRIPAALCGIVGLKPTIGRVSERGAAPLCWSVAHVGPMAASVRDTAALYAVIAGEDHGDPETIGQPPVHLGEVGDSNLRGMRLGIFPAWFQDADMAVVEAAEDTLRRLENAGAEIVRIDLPDIAQVRLAHLVIIASEMLAAERGSLLGHRKDLGLDTRLNFALAGEFSAADYVHALRLRSRFSHEFLRALDTVDGICTPTTGCTAPVIPYDALKTGESDLEKLDRIMRFAAPGNLTGFPTISFPAGYDKAGLPIGFQIMGRPWEEHLLLRLAYAVEDKLERRRPERFHDLLTGG